LRAKEACLVSLGTRVCVRADRVIRTDDGTRRNSWDRPRRVGRRRRRPTAGLVCPPPRRRRRRTARDNVFPSNPLSQPPSHHYRPPAVPDRPPTIACVFSAPHVIAHHPSFGYPLPTCSRSQPPPPHRW